MDGDVIVDSNIVTEILKDDESVRSQAEATEGLFVPVIVVGELLFGARNSTRVDSNTAEIHRFLNGVLVLDVDSETAEHYGAI